MINKEDIMMLTTAKELQLDSIKIKAISRKPGIDGWYIFSDPVKNTQGPVSMDRIMKDRFVWSPRIEQIIDLIDESGPEYIYEEYLKFCRNLNIGGSTTGKWIKFYMYTIHGKLWNGENWEKDGGMRVRAFNRNINEMVYVSINAISIFSNKEVFSEVMFPSGVKDEVGNDVFDKDLIEFKIRSFDGGSGEYEDNLITGQVVYENPEYGAPEWRVRAENGKCYVLSLVIKKNFKVIGNRYEDYRL